MRFEAEKKIMTTKIESYGKKEDYKIKKTDFFLDECYKQTGRLPPTNFFAH